MFNKKLMIFFAVITIAAVIVFSIVFCISPLKEITAVNNSSNASDNLLNLKSPETIEFNKKNDSLNISILLSQKDLNDILYNDIKSNMDVSAMETDISDSGIEMYINTDLLNLIPTQYKLKFTPSLSNNTLILNLKSSQIGRLPLSKSVVLNNFNETKSDYLSVNTNSNYISINNNVVQPFKIDGFNIEDGKIRLNLSYSIKSLGDLTKLFINMPDVIKNYMKGIDTDQAKDKFNILTQLFQ
jgi:predicted DNA-binding ArsR family transcriptional regulator